MKKLLFILLLVSVSVTSIAQATGNPYEDAKRFLNASQTDDEEILSIIAYYFDQPSVTPAAAGALLAANPFLAAYAPSVAAFAVPATNPEPITGGFSNILGLNVTKYADGIAKFLIERGKQELSMAFFTRFRRDLLYYPEIGLLFPKSTEIINEIESHNANAILQELKDAFRKDLSVMPSHVLSLRTITTAVCQTTDSKCSTRVAAINGFLNGGAGAIDPRFFSVPLNISQGIINGDNIIEIMNLVVNDATICGTNDDFNSYLKVTSILLECFRSTGEGEGGIFLNQGEFKNLFNSTDLLTIFLGLIYQKYTGTAYPCYSGIVVSGNNLQAIFQSIINSRNKFYSLLTSFDKINLSYYAIKQSIIDAKTPDISYFAGITAASISLVRNFIESTSSVLGLVPPPAFQQFYKTLSIASDFSTDIQQRNYTGIFNNVIRILDQYSVLQAEDVKKRMVKYLSFASNLASATTSDEVKDAINSVALPPGSYSVKQKSAYNISLNGYIGYAWDFNGGLFAHGVYAPLGFSFSAGLGRKRGGAISVFTSFIDVGGLASYRLTSNTDDELKQEVRLESIISPSAQIVWGIHKIPIAICVGWRSTPKLFYSTNSNFLTVPSNNVLNVAVLIDIPVFTIFNRPYN